MSTVTENEVDTDDAEEAPVAKTAIKHCPFCGAGEDLLLTELITWDFRPFDGDDDETTCSLSEHQCLTCNRSFWT